MTFIVSSPSSFSHSSGSGSFTPGVDASTFARAAAGYAVNRYGPTLLNAAQSRIDSTVSNIASKIAGNGSSSNVSGNGKSSSSRASNNSSSNGNDSGKSNPIGGRRASKSRGPLTGTGGSPNIQGVPQLSLDSGIDSGTINNPLQDTTPDYSPLFIQCGQFIPDVDQQKNSTYSKLMGKELFYKYLMLVQSEVNFSMSRNFTEENFYTYIITISKALQLYYMVDSILAFTSHTPNNNIAMTRLRMAINPGIANGHIKLREFLETTPIPPNLLMFIRHMYQNYSFSNVSGSPIIRLSFKDSLCTSELKGPLTINGLTYASIINDLIGCSITTSIISRIRPKWKVKLPESSYEALYDPQFSTFWHNSNIAYEDYGSKVVKYTINCDDYNTPLYYGIFGNRLDGVIYASCSVNVEHNVMEMGLWRPFSEFQEMKSMNSSLLHMSNDGLIRPVTEQNFRFSSMVYAAPYTTITKDNNPIWNLINSSYVGACIPQVHTLENVTQAITRTIIWLFVP